MSYYREVRVRPVVRYIVTDFQCDEDYKNQQSVALGEFDNVDAANLVADAVAKSLNPPKGFGERARVVVEPARKLRIDWIRGPGEPKEAIRWELSEVEPRPLRGDALRDAIGQDYTDQG